MADTEKKAQQEATAEKKAKKASAKTDSKKSGGKGKKDAEKKQNIFARIAGWFKDLKKEFKKVVWPDRKRCSTTHWLFSVLLLSVLLWSDCWTADLCI